MQHSDADSTEQNLAVTFEVLYLLNLLLFPGLAFVLLGILYFWFRHMNAGLAYCHLQQTFFASLWAGTLVLIVPASIVLVMFLFFGSLEHPITWIILILYFVLMHAFFIFLGALGLAKAMAGKHYHYLVIGRSCSSTLPE